MTTDDAARSGTPATDRNAYIHRAWMRRGLPADAFDGRPHIAIANTASDLTPCNAHLDEVAEHVAARRLGGRRRPARPAGHVARRDAGPPDRDALAEPGRDGDRGAAPRQPDRRRRPARRLRQDDPGAAHGGGVGRPAGRGRPRRADADRHLPWPAARLRHGRLAAQRGGPRRDAVRGGLPRVGVVDDPQPRPLQHDGHRVHDGLRRRGARDDDPGHRPGRPAPGQPAARSAPTTPAGSRSRWSRRTGGPSTVLSRGSFLNAIVALAAIGGSTNAVVHLLAIAGRLGIELSLDDFDRIGSRRAAPRRPAAGRPAPHGGPLPGRRPARRPARGPGPARSDRADRHRPAARRVTSTTPGSGTRRSSGRGRSRSRTRPGSPSCAATSPRAARSSSPRRPRRTCSSTAAGPSSSTASRTSTRAIDDPDLDVDADSVLVLRGCGPKGYPGMPEVANLPLPAKLLAQGVRDMVRICDGRMSGTAYGTVVLHVAPEAADGGPLGLVETGDIDRPRRAGAPARRRRRRRRAGGAPAVTGARRRVRGPDPRLGAPLRRPRHPGRRRAPTSTSSSARAARRSRASRTDRPRTGLRHRLVRAGTRSAARSSDRRPRRSRRDRRVGRVRSGRRVWRAASRRSPGPRRTRRANDAPRGEVRART